MLIHPLNRGAILVIMEVVCLPLKYYLKTMVGKVYDQVSLIHPTAARCSSDT